jgi:hypothetical protein
MNALPEEVEKSLMLAYDMHEGRRSAYAKASLDAEDPFWKRHCLRFTMSANWFKKQIVAELERYGGALTYERQFVQHPLSLVPRRKITFPEWVPTLRSLEEHTVRLYRSVLSGHDADDLPTELTSLLRYQQLSIEESLRELQRVD